MTGLPSKIGLLLIGVYWFGMTGLVVNNFTRTNYEQSTGLEIRTQENGIERAGTFSSP
jgi:hypothetical protein